MNFLNEIETIAIKHMYLQIDVICNREFIKFITVHHFVFGKSQALLSLSSIIFCTDNFRSR